MIDTTDIKEIKMPTVVAWEWSEQWPDGSFSAYQVAWLKDTNCVLFGMKSAWAKHWTTTTLEHPERFGFDGTLAGARRGVINFRVGDEVSLDT